jgi:hypothetical protein
MNRYIKVIGLTGSFFAKEFVKKKHHKNKIREIKEETVAKLFSQGEAEILIYFQENNREILITPDSDPEEIKKYLGNGFLPDN